MGKTGRPKKIPGEGKLTTKQRAAIEHLCDFSNPKDNKDVARLCGVSESTFYDWMKKAEFLQALDIRRRTVLASTAPKVDRALIEKATDSLEGDAARRLFYELRKEIKSDSSSNQPITVVISTPRPQR